jgi:hypothetical protein
MLAETQIFKPPSACLIGDLDREWSEQIGSQPKRLLIDLSEVVRFDASALLFLAGQFGFRQKRSLETIFRLPGAHFNEGPVESEEKEWEQSYVKARRFLREYRFPLAIKSITGNKFVCSVDEASSEFEGEPADRRGTLPSEFFPLRMFIDLRGEEDTSASITRGQSRLAGDPYMRAVFRHTLRPTLEAAERFRSTIVHEAVLNAVRHPKATLLGIVSQLDKTANHLTLSVYDDGEYVFGTLKRAYSEGLEIFDPSAVQNHLVPPMKVRSFNSHGELVETVEFSSGLDLDKGMSDALFLAAAFLPGVSRDIHSARPEAKHPGMGLWMVASNTCSHFGGSVSVRSGQFKMEIDLRGRGKKRGISADVALMKGPSFPGNLVTVRIPMRA